MDDGQFSAPLIYLGRARGKRTDASSMPNYHNWLKESDMSTTRYYTGLLLTAVLASAQE
jgi:hypothetical protein